MWTFVHDCLLIDYDFYSCYGLVSTCLTIPIVFMQIAIPGILHCSCLNRCMIKKHFGCIKKLRVIEVCRHFHCLCGLITDAEFYCLLSGKPCLCLHLLSDFFFGFSAFVLVNRNKTLRCFVKCICHFSHCLRISHSKGM